MRAWTLPWLLLAGCSSAPREAPVARMHETAWYPLKEKARWVYQGPKHKMIRQVIRREPIGKLPCVLIVTFHDDREMLKEHVHVSATGVFLTAIEGRRLAAPMRLLKLPPKAGERWTAEVRERGGTGQGLYLMGEEDVSVPAGKYRAVTLQGEINLLGGKQTTFTYWFAEGVGMVKQVVRQDGRTAVYELEKFEVP